MTSTHPQADVYAGDDWEIRATFVDENGDPFDLSGAPVIKWTLLDRNQRRVINGVGVSISITDAPAGKCTIQVAAATTSGVPAGQYTDVIRVSIGGITSTMLTGPIHVSGDPWKVI